MIRRKRFVEAVSVDDMKNIIDDLSKQNQSNLMDTTFTRWNQMVNVLSKFFDMVENGDDLSDMHRIKRHLSAFNNSLSIMIDTMINVVEDRKAELSEIEKELKSIKSVARDFDLAMK